MLSFKRDGTKIIVEVEHGVFYNDQHFNLDINQNYEYQAELLKKAFQDNLNRHLSRIKEKYYLQGWKEAKAKTKKQREFYGGWEKK